MAKESVKILQGKLDVKSLNWPDASMTHQPSLIQLVY